MVEKTPMPTGNPVPEAPPTGFALRLARVGESAYYMGANIVDTVAYPLGLSFTEDPNAPTPAVTAHKTFEEVPKMQGIHQLMNP